MKKLITILAIAAVAALAFVACKKDNGSDKVDYDLSAYNALGEEERAFCAELGLSVFWGTRNLEANTPTQFGEYYAWAETEPKEEQFYNWDHYLYRINSENRLSKYNSTDGLTTLEAEDDAVYRSIYFGMSKNWRMPTAAEIDELVATKTNPDYKWEWKDGDVKGYEITFLKSKHSIFLPAAGGITDGGNLQAGRAGLYWSSSLKEGDEEGAYHLRIDAKDAKKVRASRCVGFSIRPVRAK